MTIDPSATHLSMLGSTVARQRVKRQSQSKAKNQTTAKKQKKSKSPLLETEKLQESNGLANVKETFKNLSRIGQLPIQIDDLKTLPSTGRKKKKPTNL